jgi:tryptophan synthase beta chain
VLNHVLLHQTVIGQEALEQMDRAGEYPDVVIGCVGGGSNFAGPAFPFVGEKLRQGRQTRIIAAEPAACPTLTRGTYAYDFGDTVGVTPLLSQLVDDERRVILFNLSEAIQQALTQLPNVAVPT